MIKRHGGKLAASWVCPNHRIFHRAKQKTDGKHHGSRVPAGFLGRWCLKKTMEIPTKKLTSLMCVSKFCHFFSNSAWLALMGRDYTSCSNRLRQNTDKSRLRGTSAGEFLENRWMVAVTSQWPPEGPSTPPKKAWYTSKKKDSNWKYTNQQHKQHVYIQIIYLNHMLEIYKKTSRKNRTHRFWYLCVSMLGGTPSNMYRFCLLYCRSSKSSLEILHKLDMDVVSFWNQRIVREHAPGRGGMIITTSMKQTNYVTNHADTTPATISTLTSTIYQIDSSIVEFKRYSS